jgi:ribosomal protein S18 acetylase RimI-like enzyme
MPVSGADALRVTGRSEQRCVVDETYRVVVPAGQFASPVEFGVQVRDRVDELIGDDCELFALWVDKRHRERGLGRALIDAAEEEVAGKLICWLRCRFLRTRGWRQRAKS